MPSTYASIRSQFSGITAIATSGGSLTGSGTVYLFAQGRNRAGENLLSSGMSVSYSAGQKIQVVFPSTIRGNADELIEVVVSINSTNDPTTAKRIASWRLKNVLTVDGVNYPGQGTNRSLPYTLELTHDAHLSAGSTVANTGALPTGSNRIHGMIRYVTASTQYLRYDSEATSGIIASSPGYWVLSSQAELETYIAATSDAGGCDRPLIALSPASVLSPPPYPADNTESYVLKYWYSNGLTEDSGAIAPAGSRLAFQFLVDGVNQSHLFSGRAIARLRGYVRRSDGSLDTSMSGVGSDIILDGSTSSLDTPYLAGVELPADLLRGYAAVYDVVLKFSLDELTQSSADGYRLTEGSTFGLLIYPIGQLGTPDPFSKAIAGSVVYVEGGKLRILPDTIGIKRMDGRGSIGGYSFGATSPQTAITGLVADTPDQYVCINGALAGECIVRQDLADLLTNEAVRAIASTDPGTYTASSYTSNVTISAANQTITVALTHPTAIRSNYPDVVKGSTAPFNVPKIRVYVRDTGDSTIYQVAEVTPSGGSQNIVITSLGSTTVGALPTNADTEFCLFDYGAIAASQTSGLSSIPTGTYQVAIAYHFPSPNTALTAISHDPADGCVKELSALNVNAYASLTASFVQPAVDASVTAPMTSTEWISVGQILYVETGGYYSVGAIASPLELSLINLGSTGNAAPGATVASTSKVSAGGAEGPQGAAGLAGASAFTTAQGFTQPSSGSNVSVTVGRTDFMALNQPLFHEVGGFYRVQAITSGTVVSLTNLGYPSNASPTTTIASGGRLTAAGERGAAGAAPSSFTGVSLEDVASSPSPVTDRIQIYSLLNELRWIGETGIDSAFAAIDQPQTHTKGLRTAIATLAPDSTVSWSLDDSNTFQLAANSDLTLGTPSDQVDGATAVVCITAVGADRVISLGSEIVLPDAESNPFTVLNGKMRVLNCVARNARLYCTLSGSFTP